MRKALLLAAAVLFVAGCGVATNYKHDATSHNSAMGAPQAGHVQAPTPVHQDTNVAAGNTHQYDDINVYRSSPNAGPRPLNARPAGYQAPDTAASNNSNNCGGVACPTNTPRDTVRRAIPMPLAK